MQLDLTAVRWFKRPLVALAAGALVLSVSGLAGAATPSSTVYACVNKSTKVVRIVTATVKCRSSESRRTWSVVGPRGLVGATGPQGPAGAVGPAGPAGPQGP
jgi:hypothetical protein